VAAGILGLFCALAAARRGLNVVVTERNVRVRARGGSVRNFGLVSVTGQDRDTLWLRARRSPEVWQEVAQEPGIPSVLQGLWVATRLRVESRDAIPMLADWLARNFGVAIRRETAVHTVDPPRLETSRGLVSTGAAAACPGDDLVTRSRMNRRPLGLAAARSRCCALKARALRCRGRACRT
jgi:glycine/D-amino acid oxidase-like deaminating enzyme